MAALGKILSTVFTLVIADSNAIEEERSLFDGSSMIGELNFRTGEMDLGQDPGGFYEDDL